MIWLPLDLKRIILRFFRLEEAAGEIRPCVRPETDASKFGGGLFIPEYASTPKPSQEARAVRLEWTEAEAQAFSVQQGRHTHINLAEYAVHVFSLLVLGPDVKAMETQVDNTTAVSWARKGRATAPAAHDLARVAALAEFAFSATSTRATAEYLKGELQFHADPLSRWNEADRRAAYEGATPTLPVPQLVGLRAPGRQGRARRLIHAAITGTLRRQPGWLGRLAHRLRSGW